MHEGVPLLEAWESFYVIVGSSAGALTGLQFVVMTLIAQASPGGARGESISAFGTPNVVHFCAALLVAAILTVPWSALWPAGLAVAACGAVGTLYSMVVIRRTRRQSEYRPVLEDWLWHTILPVLAYLVLLVAGASLLANPAGALLFIGGAVLLFVFIGIHNSWDTVTYVTMGQLTANRQPARAEAGARIEPVSAAPPGASTAGAVGGAEPATPGASGPA